MTICPKNPSLAHSSTKPKPQTHNYKLNFRDELIWEKLS